MEINDSYLEKTESDLEDKVGERPLIITIIFCIMFFANTLRLSLIFTVNTNLYVALIDFISTILLLICFIGMYKMKKWSVVAYPLVIILFNVLLQTRFDIKFLLIPLVVEAILLIYYNRMD